MVDKEKYEKALRELAELRFRMFDVEEDQKTMETSINDLKTFKHCVDRLPLAVFFFNKAGDIVFYTDGFLTQLEYNKKDMGQLRLGNLFFSLEKEQMEEILAPLLTGEFEAKALRTLIRKGNGTTLHTDFILQYNEECETFSVCMIPNRLFD